MTRVDKHTGFTIIELLLALAILLILAALAVPMFGNNEKMELQIASRLLESDLELTQILAITHPEDDFAFVLNEVGDGWRIVSLDDPATPILDSVTGDPLELTLGEGPAAAATSVFIETDAPADTIAFDHNGGLVDFSQILTLTLMSGDSVVLVQISPTTGTISSASSD